MKTEYCIYFEPCAFSINGQYAGTMPSHYEIVQGEHMRRYAIEDGGKDCSSDPGAWVAADVEFRNMVGREG